MNHSIRHRKISDIDGNSPLSRASYFNHIPVVKLLLEETSADEKGNVDDDGFTALHWASYAGNEEIVRMLLEHGCHCDIPTNAGETALHLAAHRGHLSTVQTLLDHGSNVDALNHDQFTPLLLAVHDQHVDVASLLIARGANCELSLQRGYEEAETLKPPKRHGPYKTWISAPRKGIVRQTVRR